MVRFRPQVGCFCELALITFLIKLLDRFVLTIIKLTRLNSLSPTLCWVDDGFFYYWLIKVKYVYFLIFLLKQLSESTRPRRGEQFAGPCNLIIAQFITERYNRNIIRHCRDVLFIRFTLTFTFSRVDNVNDLRPLVLSDSNLKRALNYFLFIIIFIIFFIFIILFIIIVKFLFLILASF